MIVLKEFWFGPEPEPPPVLPELALAFQEFSAQTRSAAKRITARAMAARNPPGSRYVALGNTAVECLGLLSSIDDMPSGATSSASGPFRVVLMGRTQAGKSTLLEALSQGDGQRRGDGRQRFSRDVCARTVVDLPGVEVVDTPGVGALDGAEDFERAFNEVPGADLVLWVASNNSIQEETARALRMIALAGKPVVVVLNCRWDVEHPLKRLDFLENPQVAFRNAQGDLNAIDRQMAMAGTAPVRVTTVHAQAAFLASRSDEDAEPLGHASRIEHLLDAVRHEVRERAEQRRALRMVDEVRRPADEYLTSLSHAVAALGTMLDQARSVRVDTAQRLTRQIDRHDELLASALHRVVEERRVWHLSADPARNFSKAWDEEMEALDEEVQKIFAESEEQLSRALSETAAQVSEDWESVSARSMDLGHFAGFGSVWLNRAARAGLGVGGALGAGLVGAQVGAALGLVGGPLAVVTAGIGLLAGLGLQPVLGPAKRVIEQIFLGKAEVLRRRREELKGKIHPVLDQVQADLRAMREKRTQEYRDALRATLDEMDATLDQQEVVKREWLREGRSLQKNLDRLDTHAAQAVLALAQRPRLAAHITRAVRSPGVAMAVEFTPAGFTEAALFPPDATCELALTCGPAKAGLPAGQALPLALSLVPQGYRLLHLSAESACLHLPVRLPAGVVAAWSDLLGTFTRSRITITTDQDNDQASTTQGAAS